MKYMIFAVCVTISLLLVSVDSFSEPDCSQPCDASNCPPFEETSCNCESYKDYCGCCSYCKKCPGEMCMLVAMEPCGNNTECKALDGKTGPAAINSPAMCM